MVAKCLLVNLVIDIKYDIPVSRYGSASPNLWDFFFSFDVHKAKIMNLIV